MISHNPNSFKLSNETFRRVCSLTGSIAISGESQTITQDNSWVLYVGFPHDLDEDLEVAKYGYRRMVYLNDTTLDVACRLYGESLGALSGLVLPLGYTHVDLEVTATEDPILGLDYELFSSGSIRRSLRKNGDSQVEFDSAMKALSEDIGIDPDNVVNAGDTPAIIGEFEGRGLARLLQRVLDHEV